MRLSNIDTLSAYFDRLITENIKLFFFKKEQDLHKIHHQEVAIDMIKEKISQLLQEVYESGQGGGALILQKYPVRLKQEVDYGATLHSCNAVKA